MKNNHVACSNSAGLKREEEGYRKHSKTTIRKSVFLLKDKKNKEKNIHENKNENKNIHENENKNIYVDEMQSAYLCALEVTFKFLKCLEKSDQSTIYSNIAVSKGYYHMLRTACDNFYQKRRRDTFCISDTVRGRRKSLNLDFSRQNKTLNYKPHLSYGAHKYINEGGVMSRQYGGMCSDGNETGEEKRRKMQEEKNVNNVCLEKGKNVYNNVQLQEDFSILNTPDSFLDSSRVCDSSLSGTPLSGTFLSGTPLKGNFDILKFVAKFQINSFKKEELPLTREGMLSSLRQKFGNIPRMLDDNHIEYLIFSGAHNFMNYKDTPLRDLLQLTYASLSGLVKELLKLKLLKSPGRMAEINKLLMGIHRKSEVFNPMNYVDRYKEAVFDLYYFLNKSNLDKEEKEVFNKIITWLTNLKNELDPDKVHMISNRVKIDLFFYSRQFSIIVEFIESII